MSRPGRGDRLLDVLGAALRDVREDVALPVRHDRLEGLTRRDVLAADDERDLDALVLHLAEARLELGAFPGAGLVSPDRLVDGLRRGEDAGCAHGSILVCGRLSATV